jgi:hypothetical protein
VRNLQVPLAEGLTESDGSLTGGTVHGAPLYRRHGCRAHRR